MECFCPPDLNPDPGSHWIQIQSRFRSNTLPDRWKTSPFNEVPERFVFNKKDRLRIEWSGLRLRPDKKNWSIFASLSPYICTLLHILSDCTELLCSDLQNVKGGGGDIRPTWVTMRPAYPRWWGTERVLYSIGIGSTTWKKLFHLLTTILPWNSFVKHFLIVCSEYC